jgi:hypothetical protein
MIQEIIDVIKLAIGVTVGTVIGSYIMEYRIKKMIKKYMPLIMAAASTLLRSNSQEGQVSQNFVLRSNSQEGAIMNGQRRVVLEKQIQKPENKISASPSQLPEAKGKDD